MTDSLLNKAADSFWKFINLTLNIQKKDPEKPTPPPWKFPPSGTPLPSKFPLSSMGGGGGENGYFLELHNESESSDAHALWHCKSKPEFSLDPFLTALPEVPISAKVIYCS